MTEEGMPTKPPWPIYVESEDSWKDEGTLAIAPKCEICGKNILYGKDQDDPYKFPRVSTIRCDCE